MEQMRQLTLNIPPTTKPRVVIVGAGFGGLNAAMTLPDDKFQVVLFDKHNYHTFQPLLYQVASAALQPDAIAGPLRNLFHNTKDFHFRMLRVLSVDPLTNTINTSAGTLQYDYLIISSGARTNYFGNENMQRFALPLKTIPDALNMRSHLMQIFEWASLNANPELKEHMLNIVLVGAGPTGVEMAGAFSELRKHVLPKDYPILDFSKMKIYLLEGLDRVLPPMHPKSSARAQRYLEKMGVIIKLNTMVQDYDGETITLKNGEQIKSFFVVWSAGVMGEVLAGIPKEWTERGRILTDPFCRAIGSKNIFAIGDIATMKLEDYPRGHPGVAQPAIQMGKYLGKNLFALHRDETVKPFKYFDKGSLATVGRGKAVADLPGDIHLGGRLAWYIWLFVHVNFLVSFRNKLLVMTNWIWNLFTFDKGNRLIIRPYIRKGDEKSKAVFAENQVGS
ncbi:NAD(P)/FAD-dependent oxidoreductase [Chitinophaga ginsengisoli]|uniref:NADH:ubiquinone reductase (non-electrogenic) n=1 Tax=Chitinophaga ginsengisoli TaxID=363837 RepID=A0A2P8GHI5_9BACT|nr:NAD(P)/FAD-dependent oxidoreductase [Chitinophaga ginsengisoli]PSL33400.1 NADH dehydrogenase [Chitinophaga ginsengisoli]